MCSWAVEEGCIEGSHRSEVAEGTPDHTWLALGDHVEGIEKLANSIAGYDSSPLVDTSVD